MTPPRRRYSFRDYLSPKVLTMLALGFSSGLPFLLVGNSFGFWLRDEGTSLKAIGFISWVGLAYSLQFLWAPLLDRVPALKFLGQRRGWMLLSQLFVGIGIFAMAFVGTRYGLVVLGACALLVAFSAATQDIAISAWRIEIAKDPDELGLLTAAYTLGYRIALIATDSLLLVSAQHLGWPLSYTMCGIAMGVGLAASLLAAEPVKGDAVAAAKEKETPLWTWRGLFDAVAGPFIVFFKTHGAAALLMLLAISLYRMPDFVRGPMTNPFFHDLGMSKDMIGASRATIGLAATVCRHRGGRLSVVAVGLYAGPAAGRSAAGHRHRGAGAADRHRSRYSHLPDGDGAGRFCPQLRRRRPGRLHVQPDQPGLYRDAICAVVLDLRPGGKVSQRLFRFGD